MPLLSPLISELTDSNGARYLREEQIREYIDNEIYASAVIHTLREGEQFEAIGRGLLNIASLPIYRDAVGGIGTPTSDEERTKLTTDTCRLLMCINIYGEEMSVQETIDLAADLLTRHAGASDINIEIISAQ